MSTTINGSLGLRETQGSYIECLYFTFITLSTTDFGDYLPQFKNNADYSLVLLAFVGLAYVFSIFCSMNNVLAEQYGVKGRVVRSLREKNTIAKKSSEEKNSNKNEQSACNGNEIMVEAYSDGKKQVRVQKIQKGVAGTLAHLPAIQIMFIFLRTSTKIIQNFQRKRGCCSPLGPPLN